LHRQYRRLAVRPFRRKLYYDNMPVEVLYSLVRHVGDEPQHLARLQAALQYRPAQADQVFD
jgi:hypothetical protein